MFLLTGRDAPSPELLAGLADLGLPLVPATAASHPGRHEIVFRLVLDREGWRIEKESSGMIVDIGYVKGCAAPRLEAPPWSHRMSMERWIRAIAGTFVLVSLGLGYVHSPWWHLFTAFVGANLLQSAFTKWCLMEKILARLGVTCPQ